MLSFDYDYQNLFCFPIITEIFKLHWDLNGSCANCSMEKTLRILDL